MKSGINADKNDVLIEVADLADADARIRSYIPRVLMTAGRKNDRERRFFEQLIKRQKSDVIQKIDRIKGFDEVDIQCNRITYKVCIRQYNSDEVAYTVTRDGKALINKADTAKIAAQYIVKDAFSLKRPARLV